MGVYDVLRFASGVVGVPVLYALGYLTYRAYRLTGVERFAYFSVGFGVLASGLLTKMFTVLVPRVLAPRGSLLAALVMAELLYSLSRAAAYLFIALGYSRERGAGAVAPLLPLIPLLSFVNVMLSSYVFYRSLLVYAFRRSPLTLTVAAAFALMALSEMVGASSHILRLRQLAALSDLMFVAALILFLATLVRLLGPEEEEV